MKKERAHLSPSNSDFSDFGTTGSAVHFALGPQILPLTPLLPTRTPGGCRVPRLTLTPWPAPGSLRGGGRQSMPELCPWRPHSSEVSSAGSGGLWDCLGCWGKALAVWGARVTLRGGWGTEDEGCWWVLEQEAQGQLGGPLQPPLPCAEASVGPQDCRSLEDKVVLQEMWGGSLQSPDRLPPPLLRTPPHSQGLLEPRAALSPGLWT